MSNDDIELEALLHLQKHLLEEENRLEMERIKIREHRIRVSKAIKKRANESLLNKQTVEEDYPGHGQPRRGTSWILNLDSDIEVKDSTHFSQGYHGVTDRTASYLNQAIHARTPESTKTKRKRRTETEMQRIEEYLKASLEPGFLPRNLLREKLKRAIYHAEGKMLEDKNLFNTFQTFLKRLERDGILDMQQSTQSSFFIDMSGNQDKAGGKV